MIRPLHLDRLPVFKNLFIRDNIRVIPPTEANKVNRKKEKVQWKDPETLVKELILELKEFGANYEQIKTSETNGKLEWFCPECERIFPKRSQLKLHIFSHKNIKPFKCDQEGCKWSFPTIVRLKRHQKAHEGLKLFKCVLPGCEDKAFRYYSYTIWTKN